MDGMKQEVGELVLTRKAGEVILIGSDVRVELIKTGQRSRIRIVAPRNVPILRAELVDQSAQTIELVDA